MEGAGKVRTFAIPNSVKQSLLRPAHDWCMSVLRRIPMDGTYNQSAPLRRISNLSTFRSFDLSSATDRFPLMVQAELIVALFNGLVAYSWVKCGLGTNVFSCRASPKRDPNFNKLVRFETGQPLASWPLFAPCTSAYGPEERPY